MNEEIYRYEPPDKHCSLDVYKSAIKQFGSDDREWRSEVQLEGEKCVIERRRGYILAELLITLWAVWTETIRIIVQRLQFPLHQDDSERVLLRKHSFTKQEERERIHEETNESCFSI